MAVQGQIVAALAMLLPVCLLASTAAIRPVAELPALALDFRAAVIVSPSGLSVPGQKAVSLLREEVARRANLDWPQVSKLPEPGRPAIIVGTLADLRRLLGSEFHPAGLKATDLPAESYQIVTAATAGGAPRLIIAGRDDRGVLFGVGHVLRTLRLGRDRAGLIAPLNLTTSPRYALRGVQLGFRAMSNTYSNWGVAEFEQQIRDLAVFGCNAIELVAGFDREAPGDLTMPAAAMMTAVSGLGAGYGLDVWLWTPAREKDYSRPEAVARTLAEWEKLFRALPRLDGIYVPGGDPGDTPPELLLPLVEQQAALVRRYHPRAAVWISVQSFNRAHLEYFFAHLATLQPAWLTGVISAPWTDLGPAELRRRIPSRYALRSCTDIGHVLHCQYPVPDWDTAFAITEGREPICPRPEGMAAMMRAEQPPTIGSIAYSDGATDDVNKILWTRLGWDPDLAPADILREYGRYFIGERLGDGFAEGAALLEKNWRGPLAENQQVPATLAHFKELEQRAAPRDLRNWRFLSGLYRAYYDAYTQLRLGNETRLETEAMAILDRAPVLGSVSAMREAEARLEFAVRQPIALAERTRVLQLAEALFQTIGMKLSVPLYRATSITRGANLDSIDWPLNNRLWLKAQFTAIRKLPEESARVARLREIAHWTEPGPGGFYANPGQPGGPTRAAPGAGWSTDPAGHATAQGMKVWLRAADFTTHRLAWLDHIGTLGDTPLVLTYDSLDPTATYELRVVCGDTKLNGAVRLTANERFEIHPLRQNPQPAVPQTFAIPKAATASGRLVLKWERDPALASIRGVCHVSEIWLIRKDTP